MLKLVEIDGIMAEHKYLFDLVLVFDILVRLLSIDLELGKVLKEFIQCVYLFH